MVPFASLPLDAHGSFPLNRLDSCDLPTKSLKIGNRFYFFSGLLETKHEQLLARFRQDPGQLLII
jgi:hypothetical protein